MRIQLLVPIVLAFLGLSLHPVRLNAAESSPLAVVASRGFPASALTAADVKRIFLGEKLFLNGKRVKPLDNKDEAVQARFLKEVLGMTADEYKFHWLSRNFRDGILPPETLPNEQLAARIKQGDNLIGYVLQENASGSDTEWRVVLLLPAK